MSTGSTRHIATPCFHFLEVLPLYLPTQGGAGDNVSSGPLRHARRRSRDDQVQEDPRAPAANSDNGDAVSPSGVRFSVNAADDEDVCLADWAQALDMTPSSCAEKHQETASNRAAVEQRDSLPRNKFKSKQSVTWRHHMALTAWVLLLLSLCAWTRFLCAHGVPPDCRSYDSRVELVHNICRGVMLGLVLGLAAGVNLPDRFAYLFGRRGIVFVPLLFGTIPAYGALDFLMPTLALSEDFDPETLPVSYRVVLGSISAIVAILVVWHFWYACREETVKGFVTHRGSWQITITLLFLMGVPSVFEHLPARSPSSFQLSFLCVGFGINLLGLPSLAALNWRTRLRFVFEAKFICHIFDVPCESAPEFLQWLSLVNNSLYCLSRTVVASFFVSYLVLGNLRTSHAEFHLHHYVIAFMVAILAIFNHPLSLTLLGISCGIFVQGIAAYGADEVLELHPPKHRFLYYCGNATHNETIRSPWLNMEATAFFQDNPRTPINCTLYGWDNSTY
eukprot:TRINITY_DN8745_c0_g1_i2.p1 TRINITY_DN8745_c0_g1~~TRINITY_DN8745_c0_g1_i2.p1  ORF type:complete len:526 (-),score=8.72 TRINITY_DN8745_c0_g1_i2:90-1604(-)